MPKQNPQKRPTRRSAKTAGRRPTQSARHRRPARRRVSFLERLSFLFEPQEFRQDAQGSSLFKVIRFTRLQRLHLLRWGLYIAVCILCLVIQDVIMSRISILGATTDLMAGVLLLITVMEGSEVGSIFVILSSMVYYFSGSAPGPYVVGLLTTLGVIATVFRQQIWHRSIGSILLCTGLALLVYELGLYGVGIFLGLTRWGRIGVFVLTALLTTAVMLPLYLLLYRIGQIGGYTWKE